MKNITKRIQVFMTSKDEALFENVIKSMNPNIKYLDNNIWDEPVASIRDSLGECSSKFVYLWDEVVFPKMPIVEKNGQYHGPQTAMVLQMTRSQQKDNFLLSGEVSTTYTLGGDYDDMKFTCGEIWKAIKKYGSNKLKCIDSYTHETINENVKGFYAFPEACQLIEGGVIDGLKAQSSLHYYTLR